MEIQRGGGQSLVAFSSGLGGMGKEIPTDFRGGRKFENCLFMWEKGNLTPISQGIQKFPVNYRSKPEKQHSN